jgi:hypothetical protein
MVPFVNVTSKNKAVRMEMPIQSSPFLFPFAPCDQPRGFRIGSGNNDCWHPANIRGQSGRIQMPNMMGRWDQHL